MLRMREFHGKNEEDNRIEKIKYMFKGYKDYKTNTFGELKL